MGLAFASALVVLIASGVAISRLGSDDRSGRGAETAASTPPPVPTTQDGSATGGQVASDPANAAAPGSNAVTASSPAPIPPSVPAPKALRRSAAGTGGAAPVDGTTGRGDSADGGTRGDCCGPAAGAGSPGSGDSGGTGSDSGASSPGGSGSGSSPAPPEQSQPGQAPLVAASVSVGQGASGAVVGAGFGNGPDIDVTVGTNQVVGDAPPSSGTGIGLGGTFFHPPPTIPTLPG